MKAKILFNINYLTFENVGTIAIEPFLITNDKSKRENFFTEHVLFHLGNNITHYVEIARLRLVNLR